MTFDKEAFAKNIRVSRVSMKLSQEEFAKLVGCSQDTISNYESGSGCVPGTDKLIAICNVCGISPNELLGWS